MAKGREQLFTELVAKVGSKNPAGISDTWLKAAEFGWDAAWQASRDAALDEVAIQLLQLAEHDAEDMRETYKEAASAVRKLKEPR